VARIQTPQHVQELQAEFKVREQFGLELLETIQPTYSLGRQKIASEGYPRKCFGAVQAGAGGVGTNIECAIECPSGVGIIILVEKFVIESTAARVLYNMTDGVAMATVSSSPTTRKAFRDGRISNIVPQAIFRIANPLTAAPNGVEVGRVSSVSADTVQLEVDVVLGGGDYFLCRHGTANTALTVSWFWTEFLLEDR